MSVWGNCQPSLTPTNKTSNPKVLHHPFRDHGLPLPRKKRAGHNNCPRCHPGRRYWPHTPNSGGGPLCMPLCFWATQTAVAALGLFVGAEGSNLTHYLPPHSAASRIQLAYQYYLHWVSQHNNPIVSMLFTCISFCLLCSCHPFNCAVKLAYNQYIH